MGEHILEYGQRSSIINFNISKSLVKVKGQDEINHFDEDQHVGAKCTISSIFNKRSVM